ncbi:MAG: stage V sporulation protein AD [Bacillales bacterium]|nr:stage V sporulation protein AD [Bacillales bacterium]
MSKTIFYNDVYLLDTATVSGPKESKGPLKEYLDFSYERELANASSFEKAELEMVNKTLSILKEKNNKAFNEVELSLGGDLLDQVAISNQIASSLSCPFIGLYGACTNSILGLIMGSNFISTHTFKSVLTFSSSNYGSAERQFRYPINFGTQKRITSTITVTGASAALLTNEKTKIKINSATIGNVYDVNWNNVYDMGSPMAYAAYNSLKDHFKNTNTSFKDYDLILSGDLSFLGSNVLVSLFKKDGVKVVNYLDAGNLIYQDDKKYFCGGSGPSCIGLVGLGYVYKSLLIGKYHRVLLVGTGALFSNTLLHQKLSIPTVSHIIELERENYDIF